MMVNYYRFCCRIRIADEYADEVPGGEFLAVEEYDIRERHRQFADARLNEFSDWFHETPALMAHIRAITMGRSDARGRLVDTEAACLYTGKPRQTLYRWARENRITRYGTPEKAMWDVLELPTAGSAPPVRRSVKKS